jgi:tRNA threonylcarbamoyladenosine biosynthesis protein TsaE
MKHETYITNSAKATKKIGQKLAREILVLRRARRKAIVLGLEGDLGGGKTTFLQGFAKGLGIKEKILSPSFVIMKKFLIPPFHQNGRSFILVEKYFYHFDCYRIQKAKEILELGFKEIISEPKNIVAIEWSERVKKVLPKSAILIKFIYPEPRRRVDKNKREIIIKSKNCREEPT